MKIQINSAEHEVRGGSLADVISELGYDDAVIATALNGDFAPIRMRAQLMLKEGDAVEILAPMRGG